MLTLKSLYRIPLEQRIIPYITRRIINCDDLSKWNVMNVGSRDTDFLKFCSRYEFILNGVTEPEFGRTE